MFFLTTSLPMFAATTTNKGRTPKKRLLLSTTLKKDEVIKVRLAFKPGGSPEELPEGMLFQFLMKGEGNYTFLNLSNNRRRSFTSEQVDSYFTKPKLVSIAPAKATTTAEDQPQKFDLTG